MPLHEILKHSGETTGILMVKLKDGVDKAEFLKTLGDGAIITNEWDDLNIFAGTFDDTSLAIIRKSDQVEFIEEDGIREARKSSVTQRDAPWNISRLVTIGPIPFKRRNPEEFDFNYTYDEDTAGKGVDIYILDTGVLITHEEFGGRARWGKTFAGTGDTDENGHGTHCAGIAAGTQFGVAKSATIIAVKIAGADRLALISTMIAAIEWVRTEVAASKRPSIISMSVDHINLGSSMEAAINAATNAGIHVVLAAGDNNGKTVRQAVAAIRVGASNINDARYSHSNHGPGIFIFAPGEDITSSWIDYPENKATSLQSGTSTAAPHVAGLIARLIGLEKKNIPTAEMQKKLQALAVSDKLTDIPAGTVNLLAHYGTDSATKECLKRSMKTEY